MPLRDPFVQQFKKKQDKRNQITNDLRSVASDVLKNRIEKRKYEKLKGETEKQNQDRARNYLDNHDPRTALAAHRIRSLNSNIKTAEEKERDNILKKNEKTTYDSEVVKANRAIARREAAAEKKAKKGEVSKPASTRKPRSHSPTKHKNKASDPPSSPPSTADYVPPVVTKVAFSYNLDFAQDASKYALGVVKIRGHGRNPKAPKAYQKKHKLYKEYTDKHRASPHVVKGNVGNAFHKESGPIKPVMVMKFKILKSNLYKVLNSKKYENYFNKSMKNNISNTQTHIPKIDDSAYDITLNLFKLLIKEFFYDLIKYTKDELVGHPKNKADPRGLFPRGGTGLLREETRRYLDLQYNNYLNSGKWTELELSIAVPDIEYAHYVNAKPNISLKHDNVVENRVIKYSAHTFKSKSGNNITNKPKRQRTVVADHADVNLYDPNAEEDFFNKTIQLMSDYAIEKLKILLNRVVTRVAFIELNSIDGTKDFKERLTVVVQNMNNSRWL